MNVGKTAQTEITRLDFIPGLGDVTFPPLNSVTDDNEIEEGEICDDMSLSSGRSVEPVPEIPLSQPPMCMSKPSESPLQLHAMHSYEPFSTGRDEDWRFEPPTWHMPPPTSPTFSEGEVNTTTSEEDEEELLKQAILATYRKRQEVQESCPLEKLPFSPLHKSSSMSLASSYCPEDAPSPVPLQTTDEEDNVIVVVDECIDPTSSASLAPETSVACNTKQALSLLVGADSETPFRPSALEFCTDDIDKWLWYRKTREFMNPSPEEALNSVPQLDDGFLSSADSEFFFLGKSYNTDSPLTSAEVGAPVSPSPKAVVTPRRKRKRKRKSSAKCSPEKRIQESGLVLTSTVSPQKSPAQSICLLEETPEVGDPSDTVDLEQKFRERALQSLLLHRYQHQPKPPESHHSPQREKSEEPGLASNLADDQSLPSSKPKSVPQTAVRPSPVKTALSTPPKPRNDSKREGMRRVIVNRTSSLASRHNQTSQSSQGFRVVLPMVRAQESSRATPTPLRPFPVTKAFSSSFVTTRKVLHAPAQPPKPPAIVKKPLVPTNSNKPQFPRTFSLPVQRQVSTSSMKTRGGANKYKWISGSTRPPLKATSLPSSTHAIANPFIIPLDSSDDEEDENDELSTSPRMPHPQVSNPPPKIVPTKAIASSFCTPNKTFSLHRPVSVARERIQQLQQLRQAQIKRNAVRSRYKNMRMEVDKQQKSLVELSKRIHILRLELQGLMRQQAKVRSTLPNLVKHMNIFRKQWTAQCSITARWEAALKLRRGSLPLLLPASPMKVKRVDIPPADSQQSQIANVCRSQLDDLLVPCSTSTVGAVPDTQLVAAKSTTRSMSNVRLNPFQPLCPTLIQHGHCTVASCPNQHPGFLQSHNALVQKSVKRPTLTAFRVSHLARKKRSISTTTTSSSSKSPTKSGTPLKPSASIKAPIYSSQTLPEPGLLSHLRCDVCDGQRVPISTRHLMTEKDCSSCVQVTLGDSVSQAACLTLLHHLHFRHIYQQSRLLSQLQSKPALNLLQENILRLVAQQTHTDNVLLVKHYLHGLLLVNKRWDALQPLLEKVQYHVEVVNWVAPRLNNYLDEEKLYLNALTHIETSAALQDDSVARMVESLCRIKCLAGHAEAARSLLCDLLLPVSLHVEQRPLRLWRLYLHWSLQSEIKDFPQDFPHTAHSYTSTAFRLAAVAFREFLGNGDSPVSTLSALCRLLADKKENEDVVDLCSLNARFLSVSEPESLLLVWHTAKVMDLCVADLLLPIVMETTSSSNSIVDIIQGTLRLQEVSSLHDRVSLLVRTCSASLLAAFPLRDSPLKLPLKDRRNEDIVVQCCAALFPDVERMWNGGAYFVHLYRVFLDLQDGSAEEDTLFGQEMQPAVARTLRCLSTQGQMAVFVNYLMAAMLASSSFSSVVPRLYRETLQFLQRFADGHVSLGEATHVLWMLVHLAVVETEHASSFDPTSLLSFFQSFSSSSTHISTEDATCVRGLAHLLVHSSWRNERTLPRLMDLLLQLVELFPASHCLVMSLCEVLWHVGLPRSALQVCQQAAFNPHICEEKFWLTYVTLARHQAWDSARQRDVHQLSVARVPLSVRLWDHYRRWAKGASLLQMRLINVEMKKRGITLPSQ